MPYHFLISHSTSLVKSAPLNRYLLEALVSLHNEHDVRHQIARLLPELAELVALAGRNARVRRVQPAVHTHALDERVDEAPELQAQLLGARARVDLLGHVEPEDKGPLEDLS